MSDQFAHELLNRSVARTCVALGFKETSPENIDCLSDVLAQFIMTLAQKSTETAEHAGRANPGIQDVFAVSLYMVMIFNAFAFLFLTGHVRKSRRGGSIGRTFEILLFKTLGALMDHKHRGVMPLQEYRLVLEVRESLH